MRTCPAAASRNVDSLDPALAGNLIRAAHCHMLVLMQHPTESVASSYVKARELVRSHQRHGQWLERADVRDALSGRCPLENCSNSRRACRRWDWFQINVRSNSSRWQVCTRSMIEFILGIRTRCVQR